MKHDRPREANISLTGARNTATIVAHDRIRVANSMRHVRHRRSGLPNRVASHACPRRPVESVLNVRTGLKVRHRVVSVPRVPETGAVGGVEAVVVEARRIRVATRKDLARRVRPRMFRICRTISAM